MDEFTLRIILENPTPGVDFGLQQGKGSKYETIQKQRSIGKNLIFEFRVKIKAGKNNALALTGPFVQGSRDDRFVYIDIGTFAGQKESPWSRRLKIPLTGISHEIINKSLEVSDLKIEAIVPGTGKGGGPNCGTVKPFYGWKLKT